MTLLVEPSQSIRLVCLALLYLSNKFYWSGTSCPSTDRMDGKIVLITGCNSGIGKFTAIELARRGSTIYFAQSIENFRFPGARIIMACRDRDRAEEALKFISKQSSNRSIDIELVDLASLDSVRDFAKRIRSRYEKLDVLINNAGSSFSLLFREKKLSFDISFKAL